MERRKRLRADPDKTRAWQRRSAERAAERARDKPPGPGLKRTEGLKRSGQLSRPARADAASPARGRKDARETQRAAAPVPFRARVPARENACARCGRPAAQYHHVLPQQHIRVYVRGLRLEDAAARKLTRDLLRDERNLVPLCQKDHMDLENRRWDLPAPASAVLFARELGPEWEARVSGPAAER